MASTNTTSEHIVGKNELPVNSTSKIQLLRPTHVRYGHHDLGKFETFAKDFGLREVARAQGEIYYGGYGRDPYVYVASEASYSDRKGQFQGPAFVAASQEDFDKASKLDGAGLHDLKDAPGGGQLVTIARPNNTWFHVVYGQEENPEHTPAEKPPSAVVVEQHQYNTPFYKPRRDHFQRFQKGPALVHKLGHVGYVCQDWDADYAYYTSTFNFTPSDILHDKDNPDINVLAFMHLDLGSTYVDHHCFFLARGPPDLDHTFVHHASFEVYDYDEQMMGHQHLADSGWTSVWGVGRHILGSQVFDYWRDPSGFTIEHYADGDVVNDSHAVTKEPVGPISIWGPELPKDFSDDHSLLGFG